VSSGDVEQTKPAPDLMAVAMERVGATAAVAIGDSVWDCRAAERLGIPSVAVRTGGFADEELREAGATAIYSSVEELTADVTSLKPQERSG
jgi:phosphoglycolate phosphatase-like HAD superfamily hydrolase